MTALGGVRIPVHVAGPVIEGCESQWCIQCSATLVTQGHPYWPAGAAIATLEGRTPWIMSIGPCEPEDPYRHCVGAN